MTSVVRARTFALGASAVEPFAHSLPPNVTRRVPGEGLRIASINLHMGVPAGLSLSPAHESHAALRDVARWVQAVDPDVLLVQELRDRSPAVARQVGGLSDAASAFGGYVGASDMAFTPALFADPTSGLSQRYGTAIYARNGYVIDQAINARLATGPSSVELRSVGVAAIRPPDGRSPFTVMGTHLANSVEADQGVRDAQLATIVGLDEQVRAGLRVAYRDARTGQVSLSDPFPRGSMVFAGDLNQQQVASDRVLVPAGIRHVNDLVAERGDEVSVGRAVAAQADTAWSPDQHRIDHPYQRGRGATDVAVAEVQRGEYPGHATDHHGVVWDVADDAVGAAVPTR